MKKYKPQQIVPDNERPELDGLGEIFCPFKEVYSKAWYSFADEYNARADKTEDKLRIAVPTTMKDDAYNDLTHIKDFSKFPNIVTESGYDEFFSESFISSAEKSFSAIPQGSVNPAFSGLDLKDPKGIFTIYGAMPYILRLFRLSYGYSANFPQKNKIAVL